MWLENCGLHTSTLKLQNIAKTWLLNIWRSFLPKSVIFNLTANSDRFVNPLLTACPLICSNSSNSTCMVGYITQNVLGQLLSNIFSGFSNVLVFVNNIYTWTLFINIHMDKEYPCTKYNAFVYIPISHVNSNTINRNNWWF